MNLEGERERELANFHIYIHKKKLREDVTWW
jgi:hypothetical protein